MCAMGDAGGVMPMDMASDSEGDDRATVGFHPGSVAGLPLRPVALALPVVEPAMFAGASGHAAEPDTDAAPASAAPAAEAPAEGAPPAVVPEAAAEESGAPTGPLQNQGNRKQCAKRQYCWWITFAHPRPETVARLGLATPSEMSRQDFLDAVRAAYEKTGLALVECVVFLESHQRLGDDGLRLPHLNALTKSDKQHAWRGLAKALYEESRIRVDFSSNIRTWYDGVVYGAVASDHKPAEELDKEPLQWASSGAPVPLAEVLPAKWHKKGRQPALNNLQVLDILRNHGVTTETEAWGLATEMEKKGDRGLLAFLMQNDVPGFLHKLYKATTAAEDLARLRMSRVEILQAAAEIPCACAVPGKWLELAKETLDTQNLTGTFEQAVYVGLRDGRKKMNNVFLVGPPDSGKTFLLKPLKEIFRCYQQPDGGNYQLASIMGKEVVFLNDFEWDGSEKWMRWAYFKNFLEGGVLPVARPKNKGADTEFVTDAPVFGTAAKRVELYARTGAAVCVNQSETDQMNTRIKYLEMAQQISADRINRNVQECKSCAAKLYLQGKPAEAAVPPEFADPVAAAVALQPRAPSASASAAARSRSPRRP